MQEIVETIQTLVNTSLNSEEVSPKIIGSLLIILAVWLLRLIVIWIINYETEDIQIRYRWKKTSNYLLAILGLILVGRIWIAGIQSAATYLGLVSAGLAIALQGPLTSLAAWIFILWRRPFEVGDRVQIGEYTGDVVDIRIFQFTMLEIGNWVEAEQSTGRILHIPNRFLFDKALFNYTQGFEYIWNEIPVLVTFESNWEKAKHILQEIADRHATSISQTAAQQIKKASRRFVIMYPTLTPIVYTSVASSGVLLTIRHLCAVRRRRSSEQAIWEDVLKAFAKETDIDFAYPTQRFYATGLEKSSGVAPFREKTDLTTLKTNAKAAHLDSE